MAAILENVFVYAQIKHTEHGIYQKKKEILCLQIKTTHKYCHMFNFEAESTNASTHK